MKKISFLIACSLSLAVSFAQNYSTSADIYLGLKKLNVLGSVLYVAAHPDDENTRLIAYLSKDKLYRTGYLSITRGDGGQNLIGDEQGIELGLIRTQELLSARRIDGGEQFFTSAFDFGYSKTPEETFTKWNKEKILSDVVWVIRKFQPDVIITRFPATGEGGHGHHTGSAILANEAFVAAADPARFPEQLTLVKPWQAKRIFWNGFNFNNAAPPADALKIDVGGYNPVLGKSYGEIAGESRSQHKSQGFGAARTRGEAFEFFRLTDGTAAKNDLFDDVNATWKRISGGEKIEQLINNTIAQFDFMQPQRSVPQLVQLYKSLKQLPQSYWRDKKLIETQGLVEAASGLWIEVFTNLPTIVQGDSVRLNRVVNNRLGANVILHSIKEAAGNLNVQQVNYDSLLPKNRNFISNISVSVPNEVPTTQPYWLEQKMSEGYYNVSEQKNIGEPDVQPGLEIVFTLKIEDELFEFKKPVKYKFTDPVKGEVYQPVTVIPSALVTTMPEILLFRKGEATNQPITLQVNANRKIEGIGEPHIRSSVYDKTKNDSLLSIDKGSAKRYDFTLNSKEFRNEQTDYFYGSLQYKNKKEDGTAYLALQSINYDHIPSIKYFYADAVKIMNIDLKTHGKKIGYIVGAGDKVPEALEQMGYEVSLLTDKELARNNLQQFDAILSGVRAYNTNEWLNKYHDKLMKYVQNGGNLIVQYNTSNNIGPVRAKIGPYNFNIGRNRITDENAAVTFLKPNHPVLNFPNKITSDDFKDWIQERSIYHATSLDSNFQAIFRMNDAGEGPDDGSLIIAKYGKGFFSYTGLVFFRELPAGVPGAYRLLANLIALNRKKEF